MKGKCKKLIVFMVLTLVCAFAFVGCIGGSEVLASLKRHGIDTKLIKDYEIVYEVKGETFTGRAPCYGVLSFEIKPTVFLESFSTGKSRGFSSEKNEQLEDFINEISDVHSCMEIPREFYPDWHEEYLWYFDGELGCSDTLHLIYFPNKFQLIVYETGH